MVEANVNVNREYHSSKMLRAKFRFLSLEPASTNYIPSMAQESNRNRRLAHFDYSSNGVYFITFSTYESRLIFGSIHETSNQSDHFAEMQLNKNGTLVNASIERACRLFPDVGLDTYVVMPNHVHLIIFINKGLGDSDGKQRPLVSRYVSAIKSHASRCIHEIHPDLKVWNMNFYDHVIRNDFELQRIREYVSNNPSKWALDKFYREKS